MSASKIAGILQQPKPHEWATPKVFFSALHDEFGFTIDVAADESNHKVDWWYGFGGININGLAHTWAGEVAFCNPPYGSHIGAWVEKAHIEAQHGATVVMLIPARTDTSYWHDFCMRAAEIRFVRGRLAFGEGVNPAPFPSAVVVFRPGYFGVPVVSTIGRDGKP